MCGIMSINDVDDAAVVVVVTVVVVVAVFAMMNILCKSSNKLAAAANARSKQKFAKNYNFLISVRKLNFLAHQPPVQFVLW